ncbi:glycosyltransferase [Micrococcus luteus]|nr:glycosyltransferase [Micrococcus luteus]MCV7520586.1 glycosyltransferase [Micrococcus luteus]MCV7571819.1 glycosyltransferase [Micrococcus luteus]MCV7625055.1 glycosyltransferase [Micrococcus luteus]
MSRSAPEPVVPEEMTARRRPGPSVPVRRRAGRAGRLVVACILDEFSHTAFESEADLVPLSMEFWRAELTAARPDLLFVESAWRGHRQAWWNTVHRLGPELRGILEWCRDRGVPTAFWNKEDPVHFNTFLTTAGQFDAVFTTDLDCVPRYKRELGHDNVHFLPFAAQPAESNPAEVFDRVDGCAFAGAYYARYPERLADLRELSAELSSEGRRFDVYDRNLGRPPSGYTFPEEYDRFIVGGALTPDLLDVPYKGYTVNLNLNSVKQSQSMFARRVFELLASNTLVVSNFSRGLRLMFGDLVISTDSGPELRRRVEALEAEPNGVERLRAMALRKVLREHTYAERLEFVASRSGVAMPAAAVERPLLVLPASAGHDPSAVRALVTDWRAQSWTDWVLAVVAADEADLGESVADPRVVTVDGPDALDALARARGCTSVGTLDPGDWYGPHYLEDLVLALRWADVEAAGHDEHIAVVDGVVQRRRAGTAWTLSEDLRPARSLVRLSGDVTAAPGDVTRLLAQDVVPGLAVGPVEYVAGGADAPTLLREQAATLELDPGLSLAAIRAHADALEIDEPDEEPDVLDLGRILEGMATFDQLSVLWEEGGARVSSTMETGRHQYWINPLIRPVAEAVRGTEEQLHLDVGVGLDVMLVAFWLNDAGERIGHAMIPARQYTRVRVPAEATGLRWGLRVSGTGSAVIHRVVRGAYVAPPVPMLTGSPDLLVTNIYPSYGNLYRNGFVHARRRSYLQRGHRIEVVVLGAGDQPRFREFEDVDVAMLRPADLAATLASGEVRTLMVHCLLPETWEVLKTAPALPPTTVWTHGFEIQPWWRRRSNYTTAAELEAAQAASEARLAMWREVFQTTGDDVHFVFVSRWFAETVFDDVGVRLPEHRYSVIHNPVDGTVFRYREKTAEDRLRILSIRPYHSRVYANDLAVAAVLDLAAEPWFDELEFTFLGDGPLFEETIAPLRDLPNVTVRRGFLTHAQIAAEHARHGVLLVPSRSDTQGVSRDEAMSSGLVPITSAVAAIPEFVDEEVAFLAPPEDHRALADAVRTLRAEPARYLRMSAAAARRVRRQSGADHVLDAELRLAFRTDGDHSAPSVRPHPEREAHRP